MASAVLFFMCTPHLSLLTIVHSDYNLLTDDTRVPCTTARLQSGTGSSPTINDVKVAIGIDDLPPELLVRIFRFL